MIRVVGQRPTVLEHLAEELSYEMVRFQFPEGTKTVRLRSAVVAVFRVVATPVQSSTNSASDLFEKSRTYPPLILKHFSNFIFSMEPRSDIDDPRCLSNQRGPGPRSGVPTGADDCWQMQ